MEETNKGRIIKFNGNFGFISSELGEVFFHKTGLKSDFYPQKNDEIEFQIKDSQKKHGEVQACEIVFIKNDSEDKKPTAENYLLGTVKWFDTTKGYGFISEDDTDYFIHESNVLSETSISEGDIVVFLQKLHKGKMSAIKCQPFLVGLNSCSSENQLELLQKYLSNRYFNYTQIKSIAQSDKIDETAKSAFLKSAFEKARTDYQYKMLFEDCLIDIQNETPKSQIELLHKYLSGLREIEEDWNWKFKPVLKEDWDWKFKQDWKENWKYEKIKYIAQSEKIDETAKSTFLKSAFEKASVDYQYKILFDGMIILSEEDQTKFLQKYLSNSFFDYFRIKTIAQSDKIDVTVKSTFLKSAFEKASIDCQCQMLADGLIILSVESQIELLQKYLLELKKIEKDSQWNVDWKYKKIKYIAQSKKIDETAKVTFLQSAFEKASVDYQYKMLFEDCLIDIQNETPENQIELLQKYLSNFGSENYFNYNQIKTIAQFEKIDEKSKSAFLKSAFEKAGAYQYKMLFEDCLIDIQKTTLDDQVKLLQKIGKLDINEIKTIAQSEKIDVTAKTAFLQAAFEKTSTECQCIMLADGLIFLSVENQIELLQEYLLEIGKIERDWKYDKIKTIAQSNKIDETAKSTFLKSSFEKASADYQYKMLFEDCLIDIQNETPEGQIELLHKYLSNLGKIYHSDYDSEYDIIKSIAQSDKISETSKSAFLKSAFEKASADCQYKMLFEDFLIDIQNEIPESQIELLQKYLSNFGRESYSNDDQIKFITQSEKIDETSKSAFLKLAFEKASTYLQRKMLFIDCLIPFDFISHTKEYELLIDFKRLNPSKYLICFEENYPQLSKIDHLRLWLHNLNPHYNYLEFVQSVWQLSNDERKLFNKRVKEHARDERWQKFIDRIPTAELFEETAYSKKYKCKWRNIYYKNGTILVFLNKVTATEDYIWQESREEWNLLTQEYFNNRRIDDIIVTVDNNNRITEITGLEYIEVNIIIAEVRKYGTTEKKTDISSSQVAKIIYNVAARNECINFLASQATKEYNALDIQELITDNYGSLRRDVSFLFPIPDENDNVYLVWESAEFDKSKATHIFKCKENILEEVQDKIKDFIENNIRIRSRLNSVEYKDQEVKQELQYLCRVNHDTVDYQVWEDRMREVLFSKNHSKIDFGME